MKTISPVLNEQAIAALQQALDSHLKLNGLSAFDAVALVATALNVPWHDPAEARVTELEADLAAARDATAGVREARGK